MPRESRVVYPIRAKPHVLPPRPRYIRAAVLIAIAAVAGVMPAFYFMPRLTALSMNRIEITAEASIPTDGIRVMVEEMLGGTMLAVIPRSNYFAVSSDKIEAEIRQRFPEVAFVRIEKRFPHLIVIHAKGREFWGVYCERPQNSAPFGCSYLDRNGTAYEGLAGFSGWLIPMAFGTAQVRLGEVMARPQLLEFFERAQTELSALGGHLISFDISTTTPDEVRLDLAEGWHIRVLASRPVPEWSGVLRVVLEKEIGDRRSGLEYIDLRFGDKAFYKLKQ